MQEHNTAEEFIKQHEGLSECFTDFVRIAREELGLEEPLLTEEPPDTAARAPVGPSLFVATQVQETNARSD